MNAALMLVLMRLGEAEAAVIVAGPFRSVAGQAWTAGSQANQAWSPGSVAGEAHAPGSEKGQGV